MLKKWNYLMMEDNYLIIQILFNKQRRNYNEYDK